MPLVALIAGTYLLWITAKGELGKYVKLATTRNATGAAAPAPTPVNVTPAGPPGVPGNSTQTGAWSMH